jgi:hypothetical protein
MSALVPMITREMLKYDPINHTIWFEGTVPPAPDAKRTLARLAAAALATKIAVLAVAQR